MGRHVRDEEIKRLIYYAKGLGVKVTFSQKRTNEAFAIWALDGSEITIFTKNNTSKIETVLSLIHELGHQCWFIHERDRLSDSKFEEAITIQDLADAAHREKPTPKHLRKRIYEVELASSQWWESIYKETHLKFPIWRLHAQREFDVWVYEYFYETGHFPKRQEGGEKWKQIKEKNRNKYG